MAVDVRGEDYTPLEKTYGPCGKLCLSERDASSLIASAKKHRKLSNKIPLRSYYCKECGAYHLTSKKNVYRRKG